jgi:predicted transcriptional regulator YdeE
MKQIHFTERDEFKICGYSVETTLADSEKDVNDLTDRFFSDGKSDAVDQISTKDKTGHYGLMWYTQGHERYRYLIGKETDSSCILPPGLELKTITKAEYAVASFPRGYDNTKAWTDFFFRDIPEAGYSPDFAHGFFFEFYPDGLDGEFELWTPIIKAD